MGTIQKNLFKKEKQGGSQSLSFVSNLLSSAPLHPKSGRPVGEALSTKLIFLPWSVVYALLSLSTQDLMDLVVEMTHGKPHKRVHTVGVQPELDEAVDQAQAHLLQLPPHLLHLRSRLHHL